MKTLLQLLFFASILAAQAQPFPTSSNHLKKSLEAKLKMEEQSLLKNIPLKNIGPSIMSGRVVDLDVNPKDPTEFLVAYASGGGYGIPKTTALPLPL